MYFDTLENHAYECSVGIFQQVNASLNSAAVTEYPVTERVDGYIFASTRSQSRGFILRGCMKQNCTSHN